MRLLLAFLVAAGVSGATPVINTFTVNCGSGAAQYCTAAGGSSVTLEWSTTGAGTRVVISPGLGVVAATGSATVTAAGTTVYTIQAVDAPSNEEAVQRAAVFAGTGGLSATKTDGCSGTILQNSLCEISLVNRRGYDNQQEDVTVWAVFSGPANACYSMGSLASSCLVKGFAYDGSGTWKVRFSPRVPGNYSYSLLMGANGGAKDYYSTSGSFTVSPSSRNGHLRINPDNSYNLIRDNDNAPVMLIGVQHEAQGASVAPQIAVSPVGAVDGDAIGRVNNRYTTLEEWNTAFSAAGFNLDRSNSSLICTAALCFNKAGKNVYTFSEAIAQDSWANSLLGHSLYWQFSIGTLANYYVGISSSIFADDAATLKYLDLLDYGIARYGYAVSIAELFNELDPTSVATYNVLGRFYHEHSPYRPLTTTSCSASCAFGTGSHLDIVSQHHYSAAVEGTTAAPVSLTVDNDYTATISGDLELNPGKPAQFGEKGDGCYSLNKGLIFDTYERARYRIVLWSQGLSNWTATIPWHQIHLWGQFCTVAGISNEHIEGFDRAHAQIFARVMSNLDGTEKQVAPVFSQPSGQQTRAYAMAGNNNIVAYLHHINSHATAVSSQTLSVFVPQAGMRGFWIDPATGVTLGTFTPPIGTQTLTVPDYYVDVAMLLTAKPQAPIAILPGGLNGQVQGRSLPAAMAGTLYKQQLSAEGGTAPYKWTVSAGSLPPGLVLGDDGLLSGRLRRSAFSSEYPFTVSVTDSAGLSASQAYWMVVGFYEPQNPNYVRIANPSSSAVTELANNQFDCTFAPGSIPKGSYAGIRVIPTSEHQSGFANSRWTSKTNTTWPDGSAKTVTIQLDHVQLNAGAMVTLGFYAAGANIGNSGYPGGAIANYSTCVETPQDEGRRQPGIVGGRPIGQ